MAACLSIPLPRGWPRFVQRALLCAVGLERLALAEVRAGLENSDDPRAQLTAALDRAREENLLLREELRILRARIDCIPPHQRPHYPPPERFAILALRSKRCWNAAQTARRLQLTPQTIANWTRRLDEQGPDALVQTRTPVNRFDDAVTPLVEQLHQAAPRHGRRKKADLLARAGMHIAASTVGRMQKKKPVVPPPSPVTGRATEASFDSALTVVPEKRRTRIVTAQYPHHLWHVDLTAIPIGSIGSGLWAAWWPFALILRWLLCWRIALVLDHYSRALIAFGLFRKEPTARELCALLERAIALAGRAPKYIVSDQGTQFQHEYREWCTARGIRPRFGAIGMHGSIAVIERFILSLKNEFLRQILVPFALPQMQAALSAYQLWHNQHRPHAALGGRTPAGVLGGLVPARQRVRFEPRARFPLARAGPDGALPPARRPRGALRLVVSHVAGFRDLPSALHRRANRSRLRRLDPPSRCRSERHSNLETSLFPPRKRVLHEV